MSMNILMCLALSAAQDVGDRVEVTLRNGNTLRGILCKSDKPGVVSLKDDTTGGVLGLDRKTVTAIKLTAAPAAAKREADQVKPQEVVDPPATPAAQALKESADDKKARETYRKHPEWTQKKYDEVKKFLIPTGRDKPRYLDVRLPTWPGSPFTSYAPARDEDVELLENFKLWLRGRELETPKK